uniref:Uncharacterized protein n=1 Tax=Cacopsylla melanoneura TaxID=428564 RepID=A0A8D8VEK1_9HEMI
MRTMTHPRTSIHPATSVEDVLFHPVIVREVLSLLRGLVPPLLIIPLLLGPRPLIDHVPPYPVRLLQEGEGEDCSPLSREERAVSSRVSRNSRPKLSNRCSRV